MESETKEGGVQKLPPGNPHTKQMPPSLLEQAEPPSVIGMVSVVSGKGSLSLLFLQQIGIGPTFFFLRKSPICINIYGKVATTTLSN